MGLAAAVCANEHFNDHQLMGDSAIQIVTIAVVVVVVVVVIYSKLVQCGNKLRYFLDIWHFSPTRKHIHGQFYCDKGWQ